MTTDWLSNAVANCIQKTLNVRAVSVLKFDVQNSNIPNNLHFKQTAKSSEPINTSWNRLTEERYSFYETWGLTGTAFLNYKTIHAPFYEFGVEGPANKAKETSHDKFGQGLYVRVFEKWFNEPLRHVLILPVYLPSQPLGAIKVLNRLDKNSKLIPVNAPFNSQEQAFCEGLARLLAIDWTEGLKPSVPVQKRIMISYSHMDMALCDFLEDALKNSIPEIAVLRDTEFRVGEKLEAEIRSMVENCDVAIFLLTKAGVQSPWVHDEWMYVRTSNRKVIPLVEEGAIKEATERFRGLGEHLFMKFSMDKYKGVAPEIIRTIKREIAEK